MQNFKLVDRVGQTITEGDRVVTRYYSSMVDGIVVCDNPYNLRVKLLGKICEKWKREQSISSKYDLIINRYADDIVVVKPKKTAICDQQQLNFGPNT